MTLLRDHLGSSRVVFSDKDGNGGIDNSEIIGEMHYYPFGQSMKGAWYNDASGVPYRYGYNGKELVTEFSLNFYDYGARWYDPNLGSWWQIDPLSEVSRRWSPYVFSNNNPLRFIDPDGMLPEEGPSKRILRATLAPNSVKFANRAREAGSQVFTAKVGTQLWAVEGNVKLGKAGANLGASFYEAEGQISGRGSKVEINAFKFGAGAKIANVSAEGELKGTVGQLTNRGFEEGDGKANVSSKIKAGETSVSNESVVEVSGKAGPVSLGLEVSFDKVADFLDNSVQFIQSVINEVITDITNNTFNTDATGRDKREYMNNKPRNQ